MASSWESAINSCFFTSDWSNLLGTVTMRYSLLTIEMEKKAPGCGFIGRIRKHTARDVALEKVNMEGSRYQTERFAFKDITLVSFDDGYLNTLASLLAYEETPRSSVFVDRRR